MNQFDKNDEGNFVPKSRSEIANVAQFTQSLGARDKFKMCFKENLPNFEASANLSIGSGLTPTGGFAVIQGISPTHASAFTKASSTGERGASIEGCRPLFSFGHSSNGQCLSRQETLA